MLLFSVYIVVAADTKKVILKFAVAAVPHRELD
jgi:hypothetical protein